MLKNIKIKIKKGTHSLNDDLYQVVQMTNAITLEGYDPKGAVITVGCWISEEVARQLNKASRIEVTVV